LLAHTHILPERSHYIISDMYSSNAKVFPAV
jgi:hypothetical protein